jgi:hypothetical protein
MPSARDLALGKELKHNVLESPSPSRSLTHSLPRHRRSPPSLPALGHPRCRSSPSRRLPATPVPPPRPVARHHAPPRATNAAPMPPPRALPPPGPATRTIAGPTRTTAAGGRHPTRGMNLLCVNFYLSLIR